MKIEDHLRNIRESEEVIKESIQRGLQERQRNIGFNSSVAAVEMLEIYLHKNNLINPGFILKHEIFSSINKANKILNFNFENKEKIIFLLHNIESMRNILCYGKPRPIETIRKIIDDYNELKILFEKMGVKWN
jgi:hypothetical protein